jgi:hypothetical protein
VLEAFAAVLELTSFFQFAFRPPSAALGFFAGLAILLESNKNWNVEAYCAGAVSCSWDPFLLVPLGTLVPEDAWSISARSVPWIEKSIQACHNMLFYLRRLGIRLLLRSL